MRGLYDFIVSPVGERYNNEIEVEGKKLIINTRIETFKSVNKLAKVIETPKGFNTPIKKGDLVMVHHNVFRRFYDVRGNEKNSRSYLYDNKYLVSLDQVYLYKNKTEWKTILDRCFISPLVSDDNNKLENTIKRQGIIVYDNDKLNSLGVYKKDIVNYKRLREFEFIVDGQLLYCMKSNDILINHGRKENQEKHNPSWAKSS